MPPIVKDFTGNPPDSASAVSFDVNRVAAAQSSDQLFRFNVKVFQVANLFPAGGKISILRKRKPSAADPVETVLATRRVPAPATLPPAKRQELAYIARVKVMGLVPVAHDKKNAFVLRLAPNSSGENPVPPAEFIYDLPIANF